MSSAREADSRSPAKLQILHYNIERFPTEIKDVRGLEALLLMRCAFRLLICLSLRTACCALPMLPM